MSNYNLQNFRNICLLRSGAIGDIIHTLPLVNLLSHKFKNKKITFAMGRELAELMSYAKGLDQIVPISINSNIFNLIKQTETLKQASDGQFDLFLNLQPNWKTKFIAYLMKPKQIYNYEKSANISPYQISQGLDLKQHAWENFALTYFHELDLASENIQKFFPLIELPEELKQNSLNSLGLNKKEKYLALVLGVGHHRPHRAWPLENWLNFIELILKKDFSVSQIILIGGSDEEFLAYKLMQSLPSFARSRIINLCGKLNLLASAAILSNCSLAIGADTGPTHLASALGVKTIGLFGPTSPTRHSPFFGIGLSNSEHECLKSCSQKKCSKTLLNCMESLKPEEVWLAMNEV